MRNWSFLLRRSNSEKVVAQELMKLKRIPSAKKVEREKRVSTLMAEMDQRNIESSTKGTCSHISITLMIWPLHIHRDGAMYMGMGACACTKF
ncbi:hypothetical protein QL285_001345 [Trifolium repens]|nr:hypothetical protein QL285_001345 [Trifolium repens]